MKTLHESIETLQKAEQTRPVGCFTRICALFSCTCRKRAQDVEDAEYAAPSTEETQPEQSEAAAAEEEVTPSDAAAERNSGTLSTGIKSTKYEV